MVRTCFICKTKFEDTEGNRACPKCMKEYSQPKQEEKENNFTKADEGKLKWSLMPFEQLKQVVSVLMKGAKKYSPDNWKKCDDLSRYKDALMRHVVSYIEGEKIDDIQKGGDGLPHLAHAICNCLFLMWFDDNKKEE